MLEAACKKTLSYTNLSNYKRIKNFLVTMEETLSSNGPKINQEKETTGITREAYGLDSIQTEYY
ncbi:hypothetical protein SAMN05216529_11488 [Faecalicatena contorta]|uniref:Uncharacterized protein n=1 Tax=Faecalicatena contorta TaxID=39482 RepID=A0A315ZS42_9FIRM|nr:hypothetical protein A8805_11488 [Faecalicatena contorta]SUQ15639.1 hypothetical protein SAMN05216529_11488 [Faecalicatena contorta]